jgi:hypothetical protein
MSGILWRGILKYNFATEKVQGKEKYKEKGDR